MARVGKYISHYRPRWRSRSYGIQLCYAYKGGGPILIGTKYKWRFTNGFVITLPGRGSRYNEVWIVFRRFDES